MIGEITLVFAPTLNSCTTDTGPGYKGDGAKAYSFGEKLGQTTVIPSKEEEKPGQTTVNDKSSRA